MNRAAQGSPREHKHLRSQSRWVITLLVAGAAAAVAIWIWRSFRTPELPLIETSKLEPAAQQAIQKHLREVRAHPKSGDAWGHLGTTLRAFDFPAQARECFLEAQRLDPRNPRWPYFQSLIVAAENPQEAIGALRRTVQLCGNDPEMPRFRLARLLGEQARWSEAQVEVDTLLAVKPNFAPATLLLAHRAHAERNYSGAIALASRCTNDTRTARAAVSLLASLHQRNGDTSAAADAARILSSLPEDQRVADPFETEATMRRADPRELALHTHDLLADRRLQEAEARINQLVTRHPEFAESWLLLGRLQILNKDFAAAEKSLRHFLTMESRSTQGLFQLGTALLNQNRFPEAADVFQKATEIQPDFGPAHFNRGYALARAGKPREAVPFFREAIRHNPEHVESYLLLADLHRQLGEKQQALSVIAEGLALKPDDPRLRQLRAHIQSEAK